MKTAVTKDGEKIAASEGAPREAQCPACSQVVTLRARRLMNDRGFVYYWRHKAGASTCPARASFRIRRGQ